MTISYIKYKLSNNISYAIHMPMLAVDKIFVESQFVKIVHPLNIPCALYYTMNSSSMRRYHRFWTMMGEEEVPPFAITVSSKLKFDPAN